MRADLPKYDYHCLRCNRDFQSASETPSKCPLCLSMFWDTYPGQRGASPYLQFRRREVKDSRRTVDT